MMNTAEWMDYFGAAMRSDGYTEDEIQDEFDWLGIERVAALEPKPGVPPSLQHLSALAELPVADWVVVSPLDDPKAAHWLSARTGAPVVVLPHTVGALDGADDLVLLFDVVVAALLQALR